MTDPERRGDGRAAAEGGTLRLVLADQLSLELASLRDLEPGDTVLMAEVAGETDYVPHHPKKIAYLFSAMRHFAATLEGAGTSVRYVRLDDPDNGGSLEAEVARAVADLGCAGVICTHPGEHRVLAAMQAWGDRLGVPVDIREDDRFVCSLARFYRWAEGRKQLRMEYFYREMRRETGLLMTDEGQPEGGQWNFDHDNRKALPDSADLLAPIPAPYAVDPDALTQGVLDLVRQRFGNRFGTLEPFWYPVTATQAEAALTHFLDHALPTFGDYQDAMAPDQPFLYHSLLSLHINSGLLDPLRVCRAAEDRYRRGLAPLNAVEGFIRQIIGWREYMRGIYWWAGPDYKDRNYFGANRRLPTFYWTGETDMACVADVVGQTREHAYAHHIQRLMVTGQLAMLIGVDPVEINEWYLAVYADAYEWVELPNVHGMATFADGGLLASKPYAASGKYIQRMSSYCGQCRYAVSKPTGETACPFNYLYWDFLMRNEDKLRGNPRMGMIYKTLDRMKDERKQAIREDAGRFIGEVCGDAASAC